MQNLTKSFFNLLNIIVLTIIKQFKLNWLSFIIDYKYL